MRSISRWLVLAGIACAAGCEVLPGEGDKNQTITAEGDVVIINNEDGSTEVVNKPMEVVEGEKQLGLRNR